MEAIFGNDDVTGSSSRKKAPSSSAPSVHQVLSNDDLLSDILLLLPPITLILVKRVSKQWLSIITSPTFISKRNKILVPGCVPPCGLFISAPYHSYDFLSFHSLKIVKKSIVFTHASDTFSYDFRSFDSRKFVIHNPDLSPKILKIEQSCNGLLFCSSYYDHKYFICNPLIITMFKMLPPLIFRTSRVGAFRMAFDPTASPPRYQVVHMGGVPDLADVNGYSIRVQIYSSETGEWILCDCRFPSTTFYGFQDGVYRNGAIHWLDSRSKDPFHYKLEIGNGFVLKNIPIPLTVEGEVHDDRKLFGSYSSLLLLSKEYYASHNLNIYEMRNGYSEWSMKYILNLNNLLRRSWKLRKGWSCYNVWSVFLGEREEDSFMVIELSGKVLHYKFVPATVTKILDVEMVLGRTHDFIASFAQC